MSTFCNIYELCDNKTIKVFSDPYVIGVLQQKKKEIKEKRGGFKSLAKRLNVDYTTLWKYFNKRTSTPLELFKELNISLPKNIILESGPMRNRVSIPLDLTEDISKIIGAYMADGHLRKRVTKWNENKNAAYYELILREEYKSNIDAFCKWFYNIFKTKIIPKKNKNHYEFYISNKTIFLYLTKVLKLIEGRKVEITYIPEYIKKSNKKLKIAFLKGLFMFDGGVNYANGNVSLVSKSKNLILDVHEMLDGIGIKLHSYSKNSDKYGRYKLWIRSLENLKKSLILFEENTEKWYRLKEHIYGFKEYKDYDVKLLIKDLNNYYPRKRKSSITFVDLISIINKDKELDLKQISYKIKRKNKIIYENLNKLERWKILKSKKKGLNKVWTINHKLPTIRRV